MGEFIEAHTEGRGRTKNEAVRDAFWARCKIDDVWSDAEINRIGFSQNGKSGYIKYVIENETREDEFTLIERGTGDWTAKLPEP